LATKLEVVKADLLFEAALTQPDFTLPRDAPLVLQNLFTRLAPYGLRISDLKIEHVGNVADYHVLCYLFNYWMTIKVRIEKIEIACSELPKDYVQRFKAAILDVLRAVTDSRAQVSFRGFAVALGLHAKLENLIARDFLARLTARIPEGLGPSTGNGAVFYFGPAGERVLSSVTTDLSALAPEAVYLRLHGVWDPRKVDLNSFPDVVDAFVQQALESLDLQLPV
jgi:hypothetical protein